MMTRLILVGFMGAGKTSVGRKLAEKLDKPFIDLDAAIEFKEQRRIPDIFQMDGEPYFRLIEYEALQSTSYGDSIIATGGGVVTYEPSYDLLIASPCVIYLKGSPDVLYKRINQDTRNKRPLAANQTLDSVTALLTSREEYYESVANVVIQVDELSIEECTKEILQQIRG